MTSKTAGGLAGVVAEETAISTVGKTGVGLTYRGYDIQDLATYASFEEVAYLMRYGKLPHQAELANHRLHLMDILRTGCSAQNRLSWASDIGSTGSTILIPM